MCIDSLCVCVCVSYCTVHTGTYMCIDSLCVCVSYCTVHTGTYTVYTVNIALCQVVDHKHNVCKCVLRMELTICGFIVYLLKTNAQFN